MTTNSGLVLCQLWMGSLEPYMTESFIMSAFQRMGENPQNVKVMRNKYTGEPAGYCFVHFATDEAALNAMHKLSGKVIPNTNPPVRFKLNHAGTTGRPSGDREYSLWVGDLTPEVDDYTLYKTFASRYPSIRTAKVILDNAGYSKGYGFIRFANEEEQKLCLIQMNGYKGLGGKPIKISNAVPKPHRFTTTGTDASTFTTTTTAATSGGYSSSSDYSQYYDPSYWQNYSAWQGYYDTSTDPAATASAHAQASHDYYQSMSAYSSAPVVEDTTNHEDDLELIEHNQQIDVEKLNREVTERDYCLWDALESSKWLPVEGLECC
ncbi:tRNA selenocysteine 1-associated protein 1 isoform X1 [Schistocerca gregaria]|uniref:tRNA selenocysteine 1-associated protein 1 isoform X1 n=1 Tax=Schistocerca gregaria TaxID=7010 RepID=UPI00211E4627|nr:tRNA selenocysteine 1-associated protein 1 isoform X1 [Schistocerca gregaria]